MSTEEPTNEADKFCLIEGGDIVTIACPRCWRRIRVVKKNLEPQPGGDRMMNSRRECACGFSSFLIASPMESEELRQQQKVPPGSVPNGVAILLFIAVGILVIIGGKSCMESADSDAADAAKEKFGQTQMHIALKEVVVGMTQDQVTQAWGTTYSKEHTETAGHTFDPWYYNQRGGVVIFVDGVVTSVTTQ